MSEWTFDLDLKKFFLYFIIKFYYKIYVIFKRTKRSNTYKTYKKIKNLFYCV